MKKFLISTLFVMALIPLVAQDVDANQSDGSQDKKEEVTKDGWTFGAVPVVGGDSDVGFKYGALASIYYYGDGSRYPKYDHKIYVEWSRTTKGSGINMLTWDTDQLIPGVRAFFEASLLTEQALNFYGFNGYQSLYDTAFEASYTNFEIEGETQSLANRKYYAHARKLFRLKADFQGEIVGQKFRWLAGVGYYNNIISAVDVDKLNEGKTEDLLSPNSLYQNYVDWGIIKPEEAEGGAHTLLKAGLVFDTRDNEANPYKGAWTEMQLHYVPSFLSNTDYNYGRFVFTHRQYFTVIPTWVSLAGRVSYQGTIFGEMPFYMMPYTFNTVPKLTKDGVGGSKTVRGILRNRVVGNGYAFGNIELRGKVLKTTVFNQNIYVALSGFLDGGLVTQKYEYPENLLTDFPEAAQFVDLDAQEKLHMAVGGGVRFALNENFIVAFDYGHTLNVQDGVSSIYIGLDYLF